MGGGSKSSNQVSKIELPAWVEAASQENYNFAKDVSNRPYQPYGGQTVADFSPDQYGAFDYARNNIGAYQGVYDAGIGMAADAGMAQTPFVNTDYSFERIDAPQVNYNVDRDMVNGNYSRFIQSAVTPQNYNYNYTPEQVQAQTFKDADVSQYMNPYLDQVESYALQNLQSGTRQGLNAIGDQAATAGAFGGSRQGVQEGVLMGDAAKRAGELSSGIRAKGYDQALQQITADQARMLQASMANQGAGLQNAQLGLQAGIANMNNNLQAQQINRDTDLQLAGLANRSDLANQATGLQASIANQATQFANQQALMQAAIANQGAGMDLNRLDLQGQMANQNAVQNDYARQLQSALGMGQLGDQANAAVGTDLARLLSIGGMQQEQEQRYLDDAYNRFVEARDYPLEQLNIRQSALGLSPYGRTQTTNETVKTPTDWGGIAKGVGQLAMAFMSSDKDMKTDMQKVGKDKATGLDVYSYRYKGDPKSYPKVVGLMADDVEKKMPEAVKTIGGKKAVAFDPSVPKARIAKKKKA